VIVISPAPSDQQGVNKFLSKKLKRAIASILLSKNSFQQWKPKVKRWY